MIGPRLLFLGVLLTPVVLAAQSPESVKEAVNSITSADVLRRIGVIADDSMRGRNTPSPELEKTAAYIAGEFKKFGLKPGGDAGDYRQRYPIIRSGTDTAASAMTVVGNPPLRFGREVVPAGAVQQADVSGKLVILTGGNAEDAAFVSLGLRGNVATILLSGDPSTGLRGSIGAIAAQGPAAIVLVTQMPDAQWRSIAGSVTVPQFSPGWNDAASSGIPIVAVREATLRPIVEHKGIDYSSLRKETSGTPKATATDLATSIVLKPLPGSNASAPNVVGILEGSDPVLKNEYVVFSGHMDHVGVGQPDEKGDSIYNGADDDASGTTAVVEMAEAFAKLTPHPKRSLIFLTVSGEERGLWGSEFFSEHPAVPIAQIVADLNTDMVGRNWKDTIVAIGKEHSDLGTTLNRVNQAHPELHMTAIDDIWPQENFYSRSDHYNFARKGVPILFFFNGTHADYHRPGDEVSKIDGEKESRIVKLVFYLGLDLANAKDKPKWNPASYKEIVTPPTP